MIEVARRNHAEIIRYLVRNKADIEARTLNGRNALYIAASYGHIKPMEVLVELGANVEGKDDSSQTPLFRATWQDHAEAVKWLLDHNATVDTATDWGSTPLLVASQYGVSRPDEDIAGCPCQNRVSRCKKAYRLKCYRIVWRSGSSEATD